MFDAPYLNSITFISLIRVGLGETLTKFTVFGTRGAVEIEALVDTGATFTKILRSHAEKIGIEPKYETEVELADGRLVPRKLALSEIQIADVRSPVLVAVGADEEKPVLGYTTLENLGFKVNLITRQLERARPIEFQSQM